MKNRVICLLILTLCVTKCTPLFSLFFNMLAVIEWAINVAKTIQTIYSDMDITYSTVSAFQLAVNQDRKVEFIMKQLEEVSYELDRLEFDVEFRINRINTLIERLPLSTLVADMIDRVTMSISEIDRLYGEFQSIVHRTESDLEYYIGVDFIDTATTLGSDGLRAALTELHAIIVPDASALLVANLPELLKMQGNILQREFCDEEWSYQQYIFELYRSVVDAEIKAYFVMTLGYQLQQVFKNVSTAAEREQTDEDFQAMLKLYVESFLSALRDAPRGMRACNPAQHIKGETYIEMDSLIKSVIVTQYQYRYSLYPYGKLCDGTCEEMDLKSSDKRWAHEKSAFLFAPKKEKCFFRLYNCRTIEADQGTLCTKNEEKGLVWFTADARTYGKADDTCPHKYKFNELYWENERPWFCNWCVCDCEVTDLNGIRFITMKLLSSDISRNMIVTGVKIVIEDRTISLRVKQKKFGPFGRSEPSADEKWLSVDRRGPVQHYMVDPANTVIDLDDLTVPRGHVVTGIEFALRPRHPHDDLRHLHVKLTSTKFNYATGELDPDEQHVTSSADHHYNSVMDEEMDSPLVCKTEPTLGTQRYSYAKFARTSLKKDAGQTTIPFWDAQEVEASVPLGGVNFHYKNGEGCSGFLAFQLLTIDYFQYFNTSDNLHLMNL